MSDQLLWNIGFTLIFIGFAVALIAVLLLVFQGFRGKGQAKVKGGGAAIIGPIPIISGTDKESVKIILILAVILVALLIALTMLSAGIFK